ncbi:N-acetylmuramoyl-L-alanine amidase [Patescibacteria group bacterium]|nr:N-acetylmuramoyl-L-alanine amidase [Patescibacteria group bacterium]
MEEEQLPNLTEPEGTPETEAGEQPLLAEHNPAVEVNPAARSSSTDTAPTATDQTYREPLSSAEEPTLAQPSSNLEERVQPESTIVGSADMNGLGQPLSIQNPLSSQRPKNALNRFITGKFGGPAAKTAAGAAAQSASEGEEAQGRQPLGGVRNKVGQAVNTAANVATEQLKSAAKKVVKEAAINAARTAIAATSEIWIPVLIIILAIGVIGIVILFVISNQHQPGNTTSNIAGNASNSLLALNHCQGMADTLNYKKSDGTSVSLILPSTKGGFSAEEQAINVPDSSTGNVPRGQRLTRLKNNSNPNVGYLAYSDTTWTDSQGQTHTGFTNSELEYYVTMRWPSRSWNWLGGSRPTIGLSQFNNEYAGKKMMLYNPANGKVVIGIIAESGPAPYVTLGKDSTDQRSLWEKGSTNGYRVTDPVGFSGIIGGGPESPQLSAGDGLRLALGANVDEGTPIIMAFAADQSLPVGPYAPGCQVVKATTVTSAGDGYTVCIDPGHISDAAIGASATYNGTTQYEYKITWDVGQKLRDALKQQGVNVVMTRGNPGDSITTPVNNDKRAQICNNSGAAFAIHLHLDGQDNSGTSGYTVYAPNDQTVALANNAATIAASKKDNPNAVSATEPSLLTTAVADTSQKYASAFLGAYGAALKATGGPGAFKSSVQPDQSTGSGKYPLAVTRLSSIPTFLVEMFFLSNKSDFNWYTNHETDLVNALAKGILAIKNMQ